MKEAVLLHMVCISSNNDRHPAPKTFSPLHYTCRRFVSSHLNFTRLHFTALSFGLTPSKFPVAPFHLTSPHFTSPSPHFTKTGHNSYRPTLHYYSSS